MFIEYLNRLNYEVDFAGDTNFTFDGLFWRARERRVETTGESMNSSEITATFSAIDLTDVYDFLEKSFMLTDIVDLPEDVEIQKDKRVSSAKEILKKDIDGKNSHDAWRDEIFDYLSMKHIQGFYIYWMNKMII